jgi:hypothetical protein
MALLSNSQSKSAAPEIKPVTLIPPFKAWSPDITDEEDYEQYLQLASELDIKNSKFIQEKLLHILLDHEISVYNTGNVILYLDYKIGDNWELHGIRKIDVDEMKNYSIKALGTRKVIITDDNYKRAIPINILERIQLISNAVPECNFFINEDTELSCDYESFLFVLVKQGATIICGHWKYQKFEDTNHAK